MNYAACVQASIIVVAIVLVILALIRGFDEQSDWSGGNAREDRN